MAVNAVGGTENSSALSDAAQQLGSSQSLGQDAFLKLLVTQLTNQDPLDPQDQSQFLAQLAQFSTVEGINNIQTSQTRQQAANLLGKTVDAMVIKDNTTHVVTGKVVSVRWDSDGVHLGLQGGTDEITLDQLMQIRDN